MKSVILGIGTNLGNREGNLIEATAKIEEVIGRVAKQSSVYETEPWGFQTLDQFLNMVLKVETELTPSEVLEKIRIIESLFGRTRGNKGYLSREIDIDIILYEDLIMNSKGLIIPHPLMHERRFVLIPLCELEPDMIHPVLKKTIRALLQSCRDTGMVNIIV